MNRGFSLNLDVQPNAWTIRSFCSVNQAPDLLAIAIPIAIVLIALTIHEAAHAWTADRLRDPTARHGFHRCRRHGPQWFEETGTARTLPGWGAGRSRS